ncbi:uncharacterized protein LOC105193486 [Solenopsis invicta]|uniref:uncharacterized protein LOC105193486 n=1 Tax=Solenopsis invicta TaxID=13686 RepID=UPI00193CFF27|nr:uncharacterized protein LOC105193486 [Solenopsis invicta]
MENKIDSINTVCRSVEYGLRIIGVWPGMPCAILFKVFSISTMIVSQIFQYRYAIVRFGEEDLMVLMDGLSVTFAYSLLLVKMLIFAFNSRLLNEIVTCIAKDWRGSDISGEYMMTKLADSTRWLCNVIIFSHMMSVFLYAIGTIMKIRNENQTEARELIIKMEIPFEIQSTSVHVAVLVTQFIHQTTAAAMVGVLNSFLIILVLHVCGQIDIIRQKLSEITQKSIVQKNIEQGVNESVIKTLIVRHQQIIAFSKNIETLYSNIALIQFVSNTLVICCLGFLIVISIGAPNGSMMLIKSVFFYIVMSLEAFIYCFVGEHLSTKSEMIGYSAYESLWYDLSPRQNRDIQIMIVRSQKNLTLTIGKVVELSLRQFANVRILAKLLQYYEMFYLQYKKMSPAEVIPASSLRALACSTVDLSLNYRQHQLVIFALVFPLQRTFEYQDVAMTVLAHPLFKLKKEKVFLLDDIIAHVVEDWKNCDVSDEYTMNRMANISRWFSNLIIGSHAVSVFLYAIGTLLKIETRELILKMELPFKMESTLVYLSVLVTQFVHQVSAASMMAVLNCLLLTLVLHACGQIDIMRQKLSEITGKNVERDANESVAKMLIVRHQKIISFSKNIETLFSNIALLQFVSNTLVLCSLGFLIVISIGVPGGSGMLVKSVFFYILVNLEAFIYCFLGEYLSTKSKMIGDAAYEALWYELNPIQNRDILFIIVRSQKYLTLTIGKVADLSLRQFTNINVKSRSCSCAVRLICSSSMSSSIESVNTVCRPVKFGLRMIGVWPSTSYAILRRVFCISSMAVFQTFQYRHLIMHFGEEDLLLLMDVLSTTMAYTLLMIKLIIFTFNTRLLNEMIARVIEDWKQRDVCDKYTMTRMAYISRRFSNFIIGLYALSVFLYATGTLLRYRSSNQTDTRELILKLELPFEIKSTTVYVAVLVTQFIHLTSAASMVGVMNSLLITLVLHVCGQIDIVRQKLSEITRKDVKRDVNESIVKMLIIRHQRIISFSKNIEAFFSNIALIQFVSNTLVICCLGFLIVISIGVPGGSSMLIKSVFFYIVISMEAFIFCFLGEYLSTKSQKIGDAVYESLWYELDPNQNRDILIMIIRSQKHLTLTVGKVMDLSLKQFASVRSGKRFLALPRRNMGMTTLSRLVRFGLHVYGIRPYVTSTVVFRLYWIIMLSTAQVFQYRYVVMNIHMDDFSEYMDGVSSAMASSLLYIKLIILWTHERIFSDLLQMMSTDWQDYISTRHSSRIMTNAANLARRTSRWIVGMQVASGTFYSVGVLASNANNPEKLEPYTRELILKMELPFNISTEFIYTAVQSVQFYHLSLVCYGITIVNSLLVTLILHICGQIDILRECLLKVFSKNSAESTDEITMRSLIAKHQRIIIFAEHIETLYTYIALMMLLSDTIIICCLGFIIVISLDSPNAAAILVKSMLFYISMNVEAFIYCFSGEYLSAKSKMIGNAAYDSLWYDFPAKESRTVLFLIVRSQKRLTITSGKIVDLSLERFTSVVKASLSYISVLLAMY